MTMSPIDFALRRQKATSLLDGASLMLLSPPEAVRNATTHHPFRQDSFLAYLTGFYEPECAFVIASHRPVGERFHLFLRDCDLKQEIWTGRRLGLKAALSSLGVDAVYPIEKLWEEAPNLLKGTQKLYAPLGISDHYDRQILKTLQTHKQKFGKMGTSSLLPLLDARQLAGLLRLNKDNQEIERLKTAASITKTAFERIFTQVRPGMNERQVHAILMASYMEHGAEMEAYPAIVAGGERGFYLHYQENDKTLKEGELLLVDSGCQFEYYCADVTRTFPVGSKFSKEQRDVYQIVLKAQTDAIASLSVASAVNSLDGLHKTVVRSLTQGLIDLGVLKVSLDRALEEELYRPYYPHGTSHWIGMDVHDVGVYYQDGKPLPLDVGHYFSVEPGLYFNAEDPSVPPHLRGINIRIEDDVLIVPGGCEVITRDIPKDPEVLEKFRQI